MVSTVHFSRINAMETIEKYIDVEQPIRSVYNQWTKFESFPLFMTGVKSVRQLDDKRLEWQVEIAGITKVWEAEIVEQVPDERIIWRSTRGTPNTGTVTFGFLEPDLTRVTLTLHYEPEGFAEKLGDALGVVSARVQGDLNHFKEIIESRTSAPVGWRGEIDHGEVHVPAASSTREREQQQELDQELVNR